MIETTGTRVRLGDVDTWYAEHGTGAPLVLLHGTADDSRHLAGVLDAFAGSFHVFTPDRRGHGRTPDVEGPITHRLMAEDTIAFLEEVVEGPAVLVGHSDGAFVALLVALQRPELVAKLVQVSGGFHRDGLLPAVTGEPDIDLLVQYVGPSYGEVSPDGEAHFPVVAAKTAEMNRTGPALPAAELAGVRCPTLLVFADDDVVQIAHMGATYEGIPGAQLAVVPGTSHFLLKEKPELCARLILDFLTGPPVETLAPMRRAQG